MTEKAIGYLRVSTKSQAEAFGLPKQKRAIEGKAAAMGVKLVKVFEDDTSGKKRERVGIDKLFVRLAKGGVGFVIADRVSRFGREDKDTLDNLALQTMARIRSMGAVPVTTEGENKVVLDILSVLAANDSQLKAMQDGKIESVLAGSVQVGARPPLGYIKQEMANPLGSKPKILRTLAIDLETTATVMRIFDEYANGMSMAQVAAGLNADGTPTNLERLGKLRKGQTKGKWHQSSIGRMLQNPVYRGEFTYKSKQQDLVVPVKPFIEKAIWDACQNRLEQNAEAMRGRPPKSGAYLLRGLVKCGCDRLARIRRWTNTPAHYYLCNHQYKSKEEHCGIPIFHGERLEAAVVGWLLDMLSDSKLLDEFLTQQAEDAQAATEGARQRLAKVQVELQSIESKLGKLLELFLDNAIERGRYDKRRATLETRRLELADTERNLEAQLAPVDLDLRHERAGWDAFMRNADKFVLTFREWLANLEIDPDEALIYDEQAGVWTDESKNLERFYREIATEQQQYIHRETRRALNFLGVALVLDGEDKQGRRKVNLTASRLGVSTVLRIKGGR